MNSMHTTRQQKRIYIQIECAVNKAKIRGVQFHTTNLTCEKILYIREIYYKQRKFFNAEIKRLLANSICTFIKFQFQMQISLILVGVVGKNGVSVVLVVGRVEQGSETEFVKYRTTNVDIQTARYSNFQYATIPIWVKLI